MSNVYRTTRFPVQENVMKLNDLVNLCWLTIYIPIQFKKDLFSIHERIISEASVQPSIKLLHEQYSLMKCLR